MDVTSLRRPIRLYDEAASRRKLHFDQLRLIGKIFGDDTEPDESKSREGKQLKEQMARYREEIATLIAEHPAWTAVQELHANPVGVARIIVAAGDIRQVKTIATFRRLLGVDPHAPSGVGPLSTRRELYLLAEITINEEEPHAWTERIEKRRGYDILKILEQSGLRGLFADREFAGMNDLTTDDLREIHMYVYALKHEVAVDIMNASKTRTRWWLMGKLATHIGQSWARGVGHTFE